MIEELKCPECGSKMISRLNKKQNSRFWGCSNYPNCKGTRDVDGLSYQDKHPNYKEEDNDNDDEEIRKRWNRK